MKIITAMITEPCPGRVVKRRKKEEGRRKKAEGRRQKAEG